MDVVWDLCGSLLVVGGLCRFVFRQRLVVFRLSLVVGSRMFLAVGVRVAKEGVGELAQGVGELVEFPVANVRIWRGTVLGAAWRGGECAGVGRILPM